MGWRTFLVKFPVNAPTFIITFFPNSGIGKRARSTEEEIKQNMATTAVAVTKIERQAVKNDNENETSNENKNGNNTWGPDIDNKEDKAHMVPAKDIYKKGRGNFID